MDFNFCYRITYESGQFYDRPHMLTVQITKEEYKKIMRGVLEQTPIEQIEGISDVITKMTEIVYYIDRWINMNGTQRKTPLKKPRNISNLEFFLPDSEYVRINKMKNPLEVFDREEEHMTIYRNDGSSVTISSEYGKVTIRDSRKNTSYSIFEADDFLNRIQ